MPSEALQKAAAELIREGDRIVLGGSDDGGYYLIGLKRAHAEVFNNITWSTGSVFAETMQQAAEAGLKVVELPIWYDVDDADTLAVLERELLHDVQPAFAKIGGYNATATREFLMRRAASPREV
jgi:glycosyltransferase A (GT-A) superfamily protein (DUF2064 family)